MANGNDPDALERIRLARLSKAAISALDAGVSAEEVNAELSRRTDGEFADFKQLARASFLAGVSRELIEEDRAKILEEQGLRPGERGGFESAFTGRDFEQGLSSLAGLAGVGLGGGLLAKGAPLAMKAAKSPLGRTIIGRTVEGGVIGGLLSQFLKD